MLFNSWQFAIFFPVVFFLYWMLPQRFRIYILFISSYYFYMSWNAKYVVLILFTTAVSYYAAIMIERFRSYRKPILITALVLCLGVLFVFKYFNFISQSLVDFLNMFALHLHPMTLKLLLPVGISFYTFQTLSYVIDIYRGTTKPEHSFIVYATFISFFPQLVAGPIERTNNLLPQIKAQHEFVYGQAVNGFKLAGWGLFKKMIIADTAAAYADTVFGNVASYHGLILAAATFFFAIQIYCDFSGYSDIARGCAEMLGIELMENFRSPYFSSSIREFWQRWHISLSTWFRDYVYIPLGGSRCSKFRHYMNLMITFAVSGLWHGANWTFVVWGMVHGLAQILEDMLNPNRKRSAWKMLCVFVFTCGAWVFFRAQSLHDAMYVFTHSLDGISNITSYILEGTMSMKAIKAANNLIGLKLFIGLLLALAVYDYAAMGTGLIERLRSRKAVVRWVTYILLALFFLCLMITDERISTEFIYFQF